MAHRRNWDYAAGILWPVLVRAAERKETLYYSQINGMIDTIPRNVGHALGPIQSFCQDHDYPPLTALVIGKTLRVPGEGFIAWEIDDIKQALTTVFEWDWISRQPILDL